jgi:hypothetical protein
VIAGACVNESGWMRERYALHPPNPASQEHEGVLDPASSSLTGHLIATSSERPLYRKCLSPQRGIGPDRQPSPR